EVTEVRYLNGTREVSGWRELTGPAAEDRAGAGLSATPWKDGGVYLISGGAGGLGLVVAREIARSAVGTKIVLAGRSAPSEATRMRLSELSHPGREVTAEYRTLDVTDGAAVVECVEGIVARFGALNGIVHCAGVLDDHFVVNKTVEQFGAVLAPKIRGAINLDQATRHAKLDFMILFSSISGVLGNLGQSDYATANAFIDRFAMHRDHLTRSGVRHGRTLAIAWPLWAQGGMKVDEATMTSMRRRGFDALDVTSALMVLYRAWRSELPQVTALYGVRRKLVRLVGLAASPESMEPRGEDGREADYRATTADRRTLGKAETQRSVAAGQSNADPDELVAPMRRALVEAISRQLKLRTEDVGLDAEFSAFGFDSISLTKFAAGLNERYELTLSPTVFFEHATVSALARYLIGEHRARIAPKLVGSRQ
ncbi:MAG: beta-ketoacyl reductase, partial [Steroidobacteraceae bacterium]